METNGVTYIYHNSYIPEQYIMPTIQILNTIVQSILVSNWTTTFTWMTSILKKLTKLYFRLQNMRFYFRNRLNSQLFSKLRQLSLKQLVKFGIHRNIDVLISTKLNSFLWPWSLIYKILENPVSGVLYTNIASAPFLENSISSNSIISNLLLKIVKIRKIYLNL